MRNKLVLFMLALVLLISTACGSDNNENETNNANNTDEANAEEVENNNNEANNNSENDVEDDESEAEVDSGDLGFETVLKQIEENTEGSAEISYKNEEADTFESEQYTITLDGYAFIEVADFHQDYSVVLGDEEQSGLIASHITIENTSDEDIAYNPIFDMRYSGANRFPGESLDFTDRDELLSQKLKDNDRTIEAGKKVSGYYVSVLHPEDIEGIKKAGEATLTVPEAGDEYDEEEYGYKNKIGEKTEFTIVIDGEGAEKNTEKASFYPDKTITENMGDKSIVKENTEVNESEKLAKSTFTLEGYQFAEFEPNEATEPMFANFDEGVVLLTLKFIVDNGEDEEIDLKQKAKLNVNNGKEYLLQEGLLSPHTGNASISPGDEEEMYIVFTLEKENYDKIWKDKSFEVEVGALLGMDTYDLSKGKKITFDLTE